MKLKVLTGILALASANLAHGAMISFTDANLASGNPVTVGGVTLTTSNVGGSIGFIGAGQFTGLHLGGNNTSGFYSLGFSQLIQSIEIEFDALSDVGTGAVETLFNFGTSNGAANISYANQFGTTFNGTTITSTENDGQGIISFAGAAFNLFSFNHNQGSQAGFVIERLVINTFDGPTNVPEPATLGMLGMGLLGLVCARRKRIA